MFFLTLLQALQLALFGATAVSLLSDDIPIRGRFQLGEDLVVVRLACDGKSSCQLDLPTTLIPLAEYDHVTVGTEDDIARANRALAHARTNAHQLRMRLPFTEPLFTSATQVDRCVDLNNPKNLPATPAHSLVCHFAGTADYALVFGPADAQATRVGFKEYSITPIPRKE